MTLDQAKAEAQRRADAEGEPMVVTQDEEDYLVATVDQYKCAWKDFVAVVQPRFF